MNQNIKSVPFHSFSLLKPYSNLVHFITTREGGVSEGPFSSLNLSFRTGDNPIFVEQNRTLVAESFFIDRTRLIFPTQTHGDKVVKIDQTFLEKSEDEQNIVLNGVDALITDVPGVCLCILTADCASIMVFDPVIKAIGIVHAGWRGTLNKIVTKTIASMSHHFGSDPTDLLVGIGPCISLNAFEVGEEVASAFMNSFSDTEGIVIRNPIWPKPHVDIKKANTALLINYGILKEHIEISGSCTFSSPNIFYSARKNSGGRFSAGIMLKKTE
jgi:polyphenol oxidase